MINLLRTIRFPGHLHSASHWIKASVIQHVSNYDELIRQANREADAIVAQAEKDAQVLRAQARQEAAESLRGDMNKILEMNREQQNTLRNQTRLICEQICLAVMERFIAQTDDQVRIKVLVEDLIAQSYNARELHVHCHPKHEESASRAIAEVLADRMNLRKFQVHPSSDMAEYELKVLASNGSEVYISLDNAVALLSEEASHFIQQNPDLQPNQLDSQS